MIRRVTVRILAFGGSWVLRCWRFSALRQLPTSNSQVIDSRDTIGRNFQQNKIGVSPVQEIWSSIFPKGMTARMLATP